MLSHSLEGEVAPGTLQAMPITQGWSAALADRGSMLDSSISDGGLMRFVGEGSRYEEYVGDY